jgi:hypothetical protein
MFFIGDRDYSENTRSIGSMLEQFSKDRNQITQMLRENPNLLVSNLWQTNSPISKDEECFFHMGKNLYINIDDILLKPTTVCDSLANFYVCPQCKNMRRLIEFSGSKKTNAEEPFMLECGEKAGSSLYFEEKDITSLYLLKEIQPYSVKRAYANPFIAELARCSSATCAIPSQEAGSNLLLKYMETEYLGSDPFTNNMLINYYLNQELTNLKIPHIIHTDISFVCNNNGYNINEFLDIGNIQNFQEFPEFLESSGKPSPTSKADDKLPISKDVVKSTIIQLFACLHALRKYDFSHGNPNTETIRFKKEPVSYIHDGVHVNGPITMKILDLSTSGCSVLKKDGKFLRLYSKSVVADEELKKRIYEPIIETVSLNDEENKVTVYKLKNPCKCVKASILFMYMKHLGLPVYSASFDAYSFITVLMTERSFYSTVLADSQLSKFWRNMWVNNEDFDKITERIKEFHEKTTVVNLNDILKTLSDLSLRCDMIDFGWNFIKTF